MDLGYDSYNAVMILNTIALAITIYVCRVLFLIILRIFLFLTSDCPKLKSKKLRSLANNQRKQLFFGDLYLIYIEGFIEIMIAIKLSTDVGATEPFGELCGRVIVYFSMFVIFFLIPSGFIMIVYFDKHILEENPYFIAAYG